MGVYVCTGIVYEIFTEKKEDLQLENIKQALEENIPLENYVFSEKEDCFSWTLKENVLMHGNLSAFLKAQFDLYYGEYVKREKELEELLDLLKKATSDEEIIALAKSDRFYEFRLIDKIRGLLYVKKDWSERSLRVRYDMFSFFLDGKILMECYGRFFNYLERTIRLQEKDFPIAKNVKILMHG
ncbi:MAG TPA: hypothetical protein VI959_00995 [Alphaproteobacteria bacterium]|nr:hypothetical protein [Alphaproteobacteria bacterium]